MDLLLDPAALLLAHTGGGAGWQALTSMMAIGLAGVFVLVVIGRIPMERPDDLVLPLATIAILSALAPAASDTLSDWVGWAIPVGSLSLIGLLAVALGSLSTGQRRQLGAGVAALAALGVVVGQQPIKDALHPVVEAAVLPDDAEVAIVGIATNDVVAADGFAVVFEVTGGSIGPVGLGAGVSPDPEELAQLIVFIDSRIADFEITSDCTVVAPCTRVEGIIRTTPGRHQLAVELRPSGGFFASAVADSVTIVAR